MQAVAEKGSEQRGALPRPQRGAARSRELVGGRGHTSPATMRFSLSCGCPGVTHTLLREKLRKGVGAPREPPVNRASREQVVQTSPEWFVRAPGQQDDGAPGCGVCPGDLGRASCSCPRAPIGSVWGGASGLPLAATSLQPGSDPQAQTSRGMEQPSQPAHSGSHRERHLGDVVGVLGGQGCHPERRTQVC